MSQSSFFSANYADRGRSLLFFNLGVPEIRPIRNCGQYFRIDHIYVDGVIPNQHLIYLLGPKNDYCTGMAEKMDPRHRAYEEEKIFTSYSQNLGFTF